MIGRFALLALLLTVGCAAPAKVIVATAAVATVETVDTGIDAFTAWAVPEEARIAADAIAGCKDKATRAEYTACTSAITAPRRAPIDKAKAAISVYRAAVAAGLDASSGAFTQAVADVITSLAQLGIHLAVK